MKIVADSRVLVTGGAGFIGSNLVERLLADGNEVVVLDNFSTGSRQNLAAFQNNPSFSLIEGDIRDIECCRRAVDGVQYVLHEAALGSVPFSIKDPMSCTAVNISGFVNMLFAAQEAGVKRFVYASSSAVYGDNPVLPKCESDIGKPLSPYAITKLTDEIFARNFHELYGIDTVGMRFFNVFGRRQNPFGVYAAVIPIFVADLLKHRAPTINGDGMVSRDYTHVDNVVAANLLALKAVESESLNQVYNVACGESVTLNRLFETLRDNLAEFDPAVAAISPVYGPPRRADIPHSLADISKIESGLGYKPVRMFADGIKATARWYVENICK